MSAVVVAAAAISACSSSPPKTTYYVSIGDSFAVGVQPNSSGESLPTDQGYADDLFNDVRAGKPGLQLVKLGCSGETTTTAIRGGICQYEQGSQLAAATSFIRSNRGSIDFVTVELGANNFEQCALDGRVDAACVLDQVSTVKTELPQIFQELRSAGGPELRIVGMDLFDPFLAQWLTGPLGQTLAQQSVPFAREFNDSLASTYQTAAAKTADVADAFSTYASFADVTDLAGFGSAPVSVARICQWTWACVAPPVGPNEHPNAVGYRQIADAFRPLVS